jgi:glutamate-1-semialdehyde 2,1-aminomutase
MLFNDGYRADQRGFFVGSADGPWLNAPDGRRWLDTAMAAGTALLGHAPPVVTEAVAVQAARGTLTCCPAPLGDEYGRLLAEMMPWFAGFILCSTGSEATMRAIRIARAVTGRPKVALCAGGWHGTHDLLLAEDDASAPEECPHAAMRSAGSPACLLDQLVLLPYDNAAAFDLIRRHGAELACVILEPVQGSNPRGEVGPFLAGLRAATRECGALLCFDEVITGGRLGLGGAQRHFGIEADLATYGKIVGGGLPIGVIGATAWVLDRLAVAGIRGAAGEGRVILGGTFSANPLTLAAGTAFLGHLLANAGAIHAHVDHWGGWLRDAVNRHCRERDIAGRMIGVGSISRLLLTDVPIRSARQRDRAEAPASVQAGFYRFIHEAGIHVAGNRLLFTSTRHGEAEMAVIRDGFVAALERLRDGAFA